MQRTTTVLYQDIQGREQCRGSVALVIVGHGRAFAGLHRQALLGAIKRQDLAFLVDGQHHRVARRVHVKANHILNLFGEGRIVGLLEGAWAVRLPTSVDWIEGATNATTAH